MLYPGARAAAAAVSRYGQGKHMGATALRSPPHASSEAVGSLPLALPPFCSCEFDEFAFYLHCVHVPLVLCSWVSRLVHGMLHIAFDLMAVMVIVMSTAMEMPCRW